MTGYYAPKKWFLESVNTFIGWHKLTNDLFSELQNKTCFVYSFNLGVFKENFCTKKFVGKILLPGEFFAGT